MTSSAAPARVPPTGRGAGGGVLVVVPTYDEVENLAPVLERLHAALPGAHALVVDDASPDGTGQLADRLAALDPRVHVLHRAGKAGLGAAYVAGFRWGLAARAEPPHAGAPGSGGAAYGVLVEMDADGSHAPEDLPRLLAALDGGGGGDVHGTGADLALGSRWVPGGRVVDWPRSRVLLSRAGNRYVRLALGLPVHDATGGFRAYRRSALEALDLGAVVSQGYCFQVDLVWRTHRAGLRVVEVPITFVERARGRSKMDRAIVLEALWRVTAWGAARLLGRGGAGLRS